MCHLIEVGKVLEWIVASRITSHLSHIVISENQYGFQTVSSTIDTIDMVGNYAQTADTQGGVSLSCQLI